MEDQIGHAFARHGRGGENIDICSIVFVFPIQFAVDAILGLIVWLDYKIIESLKRDVEGCWSTQAELDKLQLRLKMI